MSLTLAEIEEKQSKLPAFLIEIREKRKKLSRIQRNIIHEKQKRLNPKKNRLARRERPSLKEKLNRGTGIFPPGISQSKYNADGSLRG
jgi:hypothetical protein